MKIWHVQSIKSLTMVAPLIASFWVSGCAVLQPIKQQEVAIYALDVVFEPGTAATSDMTLLVNTPIAYPGFDSSRMIYIRKPHEIDYFSHNQWVDSPARMLAPLLVRALEHTAQFRAVIQARSAAKADLRVDTEIIRLQHEFLSSPSQVHLTMRVQLLDIQGKSVLAAREFDLTETAASDDPYAGVLATNRAVKKMLTHIAAFCVEESKSAKIKIASEADK